MCRSILIAGYVHNKNIQKMDKIYIFFLYKKEIIPSRDARYYAFHEMRALYS